MKQIAIAINGFGRIGRCVARIFADNQRADLSRFRLVGINSRAPAATAAHLLKYDSTHGIAAANIAHTSNAIVINGQEIPYSQESDLANLPWRKLGAQVALECSGKFNDAQTAAGHISAGAQKILFSAPAKNVDLTVVYGVNHHRLTADMQAVSNASCTTNCAAPVAAALHQLAGIKSAMLGTVHAYTNDQQLLDASHKDLRRARAGAVSLIPASTGAAKAIGLVLPELAGKISGAAVRVPAINVSLIDLTCALQKPVSARQLDDAMRAAAEKSDGVLAVNDLPLVSCDFNGRAESAIYDATQTQSDDNGLVKAMAWYDNEWAFSHRMLDVAAAWMDSSVNGSL